MGIKGIYNEIGSGQRIALSKLALETYEQKGRPLRIAIDISIWLFQIQAGKGKLHLAIIHSHGTDLSIGGSNPALRTFYYRLLRLISLAIHPLFVFDGPNKPPFKRNKRTGPNVASIPEFLAKQLLRAFGLPFHLAPGEAEAECALLQKKGIVDVVLSEDVDTLMFGSGLTIRNWSPEVASSKVPTHINLYDAEQTKNGSSGLDSDGMILVAIMSGGDYVPEGIPGCGPKTACEAARAGFGKDLCNIARNDSVAIQAWKDKLCHELKSNESKYFRAKHKALVIPEDFPRPDVLNYYTRPCVSSDDQVEKLREHIKWDQQHIDIAELRRFTADAFDWTCLSGAKKFIRNLAPALLVKDLRLRAEKDTPDDLFVVAQEEEKLIRAIYQKRNHVTTDETTELRIGFLPLDIVDLDLDAEEPDPETTDIQGDSEDDEVNEPANFQGGEPTSPKKKRAPSAYDPTKVQKHWIFETLIKAGVPLRHQDWEESFRTAQKYEAMKAARKRAETAAKELKKTGGMRRGALDSFARVSKPRPQDRSKAPEAPPVPSVQPSSEEQNKPQNRFKCQVRRPPVLTPPPPLLTQPEVIHLLSSSPPASPTVPRKRSLQRSQSDNFNRAERFEDSAPDPSKTHESDLTDIPELPTSVQLRRKRLPLRRSQSTGAATTNEEGHEPSTPPEEDSIKPFGKAGFRLPQQGSPTPRVSRHRDVVTPSKRRDVITIGSSPVSAQSAQKNITDWFRPSVEPPTPSPIRKRPAVVHKKGGDANNFRAPRLELRSPLIESSNTSNCCGSPAVQAQATGEDVETVNMTINAPQTRESNMSALRNKEPSKAVDQSLQETKKRIQLRQSLAGAWKEAEMLDATTSPNKDKGGGKGRGRSWRVSQVDILDLTGA